MVYTHCPDILPSLSSVSEFENNLMFVLFADHFQNVMLIKNQLIF